MDFDELVCNREHPRTQSESLSGGTPLSSAILVPCLPAFVLVFGSVVALIFFPLTYDRIGCVSLAYDPMFQIVWLTFALLSGTFLLRPLGRHADAGRVVSCLMAIAAIHVGCFVVSRFIIGFLALIGM